MTLLDHGIESNTKTFTGTKQLSRPILN